MDTTNHCENCEALAKVVNEEVEEFNRGFDAARHGDQITAEPSDIVHDQWRPGWAFGAVDGLLKENEELRKAVAVKDELLVECGNNIHTTVCDLFITAGGECCGLHKRIKAALSSTPSGMRVVSVEKLAPLWAFLDEAHATQVGAGNSELYDWVNWLSALIGGDDEHAEPV